MIVEISTSILSLDYTDQTIIDQAVMRVTNANYIHFDIMDGKFVHEKSYGAELVKNTNLSGTKLEKDVHLMIKDPEKAVTKFIKAGATIITFHAEAAKSPKKLVEKIRKEGVLAGIALSPATPLKKIEKLIKSVDLVLVMTVKPGKPGQKLMKSTIKKVKDLRKMSPSLTIEVDGGINADNAHLLIEAGANILVSGSYIFKSKDPKLAIDILRNS